MEFKILILFALIGAISSLVAGLIAIAYKWKVIQWYEVNRLKWMPPTCYFCLAFWLSCGILASLFWYGFPFDYLFLFSTISSAAIASYILDERN